MENLNYYLQKAREGKYAIAHFNFASAEQLKGVIQGFENVYKEAYEEGKELAIMVGTSEGEANFFGYNHARALIDSWKQENSLPIFLNADHHKSFETIRLAVDAGYDTVLIDSSNKSFDENVSVTKESVEYLKSKNSNGSVEGELGYLRGSSEIQKNIEISKDDFAKPEEVKKFISETSVDRIAVAVGNIHGITTDQEMKIDFDLLKEIALVVGDTHIVLHGGSGLKEDDFVKAIDAGVTNIHINTEVRIAYRRGIEEIFKSDADLVTPYKYLNKAVENMIAVVEKKVRLFARL